MPDRPLSPTPSSPMLLTRRGVLGLGLGAVAAAVLASCTPAPQWVTPTGAAVSGTEKNRGGTGRVTTVDLTAAPTTLDLAGTSAATWAFGGIPAPVIRLTAGDTLKATVRNQLDADTSVHWHGLALRNDMDGVPPVTQAPIAPGGQFAYEFVTPHPGTYWFHPHVGPQLDHGLYGALIIDDPDEKVTWDDEWVLILDDWLDGVTATPDQVLTDLSKGMGDMGGMGDMFMRMGNLLMGATSDLLGGDAGDVYYPHYLINGKPKADPAQFTGTPGARVRIRVINAGSDTAFRFAIGGHTLTITHTDGFPVDPVEVDSVLIGMGRTLRPAGHPGRWGVPCRRRRGRQAGSRVRARSHRRWHGSGQRRPRRRARHRQGRHRCRTERDRLRHPAPGIPRPGRAPRADRGDGGVRLGDQWAPVRHERPVAGRARGQYGGAGAVADPQ